VTAWNTFRLAAVAIASLVAVGADSQDEETLEWLNDYDEAFALAKETGRPVLLEFRCAP